MSNRALLLSWDNTGLEGVVEVDYDALDLEQQNRVASILSNPKGRDPGNPLNKQLSSTLSAMKLRAIFNTQRHYEIYLVPVGDAITEQHIRKMFENTPQDAADLMRERGTQLYSDRARHDQVVIR
jgi:hypothetical protein